MKTQVLKTALFWITFLGMRTMVHGQENTGDNYHPFYKNVIKFETFSPLMGHTTIGYARFIKPKVSLEGKFSLIGVSLNVPRVPRNGFYAKFGPCFYSASKNEKSTGSGLNFIEGLYLRPDVSFTSFSWFSDGYSRFNPSTGDYEYIPPTTIKETYGTLMVNSGIEANLSKRFQLDLFAGVGYEIGFERTSVGIQRKMKGGFRYSHLGGGGDFPIAFTSGFTLGYRF